MQPVYDNIFYPRPFKSYKVTATDSNGFPSETTFYEKEDYTGAIMFKWKTVNDASGRITQFTLSDINDTI